MMFVCSSAYYLVSVACWFVWFFICIASFPVFAKTQLRSIFHFLTIRELSHFKPLPSLNHHFRCILLPRPSLPLSPLYYVDNLVLIQNFDTGTAGGAGDKYEVWLGLNHHFRCTIVPRPSPPPTCHPCPATFNCTSIYVILHKMIRI